MSAHKDPKLIECQTCFRTFYTQGQFGQHSRICRGGANGSNSKSSFVEEWKYKYSFLEKQSKNQLEIKSRFVINILKTGNDSNKNITWKQIAKQNELHDNGVKQLLKSHNLECVYFTVRNRKESGLIIANFIMRSVHSAKTSIHSAKVLIEDAIDIVKNKLPSYISMEMHLCSIKGCKEIVIRDTEGHCSRHRAQKYHKKINKKRALIPITPLQNVFHQPKQKKLKLHHLLPVLPVLPVNVLPVLPQTQTNNMTNMNDMHMNNMYNIFYSFFEKNCFIFQTPSNLINVSLNESKIRQNGMNLISINYSTQIPNTKQILKRNDYLITFGFKQDIKLYFNKHISIDLLDIDSIIISNKNSIRFQEFCAELIKYYIVYIRVPSHFIGKTLSEIRLYEYGINIISVNLNVQHALKMSKYSFKTNDMLLCCFNRANNKHQRLYHAFSEIKFN